MKLSNTKKSGIGRVQLETEKQNKIFVEEISNEPIRKLIESSPVLRDLFNEV